MSVDEARYVFYKSDDIQRVSEMPSEGHDESDSGDRAALIFHLQLIMNDCADWEAKAQVVAVFHTNAGHVTLHDQAYNADRKIATGNPYKQLVTDLMKRGVQVELCGATAKVHNYGNADLLPGIKINTDAMARTTQLVQEGFINGILRVWLETCLPFVGSGVCLLRCKELSEDYDDWRPRSGLPDPTRWPAPWNP